MEISSAESLLSQVRDYQAKIASARRDTGDLGSIPSIGDAGRGQGVDGAAGNFSSRLSTAMVNSLNEVNAPLCPDVSMLKSNVNRLMLVKVSLRTEKIYEYCVIRGLKVFLILTRYDFSYCLQNMQSLRNPGVTVGTPDAGPDIPKSMHAQPFALSKKRKGANRAGFGVQNLFAK